MTSVSDKEGKWNSLSPKQWMLVGAGAAAVAGSFAVYFLSQPDTETIDDIDESILSEGGESEQTTQITVEDIDDLTDATIANYIPSASSGIFGIYKIESPYLPSVNSGVFGIYMIKALPSPPTTTATAVAVEEEEEVKEEAQEPQIFTDYIPSAYIPSASSGVFGTYTVNGDHEHDSEHLTESAVVISGNKINHEEESTPPLIVDVEVEQSPEKIIDAPIDEPIDAPIDAEAAASRSTAEAPVVAEEETKTEEVPTEEEKQESPAPPDIAVTSEDEENKAEDEELEKRKAEYTQLQASQTETEKPWKYKDAILRITIAKAENLESNNSVYCSLRVRTIGDSAPRKEKNSKGKTRSIKPLKSNKKTVFNWDHTLQLVSRDPTRDIVVINLKTGRNTVLGTVEIPSMDAARCPVGKALEETYKIQNTSKGELQIAIVYEEDSNHALLRRSSSKMLGFGST